MAEERTDRQAEAEATERIVVALDASPNSVAALRAAAELASWLGVDLEGLFIEDINLTRLCELPNQHEVGSYTGSVRRLETSALQRQLRAMATSIRKAMAQEATRRPVRWEFHVRRGPVVTELLAASQSASVVSVGRSSRGRRRDLGSTASSIVRESSRPVLVSGEGGDLRSPLTVLFTGSDASERALRFAITLHYRRRGGMRILVWSAENGRRVAELSRRAETILRQANVDALIIGSVAGELSTMVTQEPGTLVLPRENAGLVSEHSGPAILVP